MGSWLARGGPLKTRGCHTHPRGPCRILDGPPLRYSSTSLHLNVVTLKVGAFISTSSPKPQNDSREVTTKKAYIHRDKRIGEDTGTDEDKKITEAGKSAVADLKEQRKLQFKLEMGGGVQ